MWDKIGVVELPKNKCSLFDQMLISPLVSQYTRAQQDFSSPEMTKFN